MSIPRPKAQNYSAHRNSELVAAVEVCHEASFLSLLASNSRLAQEQLRRAVFCQVNEKIRSPGRPKASPAANNWPNVTAARKNVTGNCGWSS
jgi:hypothetical protein